MPYPSLSWPRDPDPRHRTSRWGDTRGLTPALTPAAQTAVLSGTIVLRNHSTNLCIDDSTGFGLRGFDCQSLTGADIVYQEFSAPVRDGIVSSAQSQVGYQDDPAGSYCNTFTAYWGIGTSCEAWCADFAAWAWDQGGSPFTYGYPAGDINAGAVSFYVWGADHGTWHAAGSGYAPQPGDVAVYGLDTSAGTAQHVAVVTGGVPPPART